MCGEPREECLPLFHAKRLAFFGTVLVCTVLLTACPRVGVNPIAPGYLLFPSNSMTEDICDADFLIMLFANNVLIYDNRAEAESLLKRLSGISNPYYRIPQEMQTGALLRIDIECYRQEQGLIEAFRYEETIRYPVFSKSGAFFHVEIRSIDDPREDCLIADTQDSQDETQLCIQTNLFSDK